MSNELALPHRDSALISLQVSTPEELYAQQCEHFTEWGGALSKEAYLRREKHLFHQEATKDGNLTQWMLVYTPQVNGKASERQVLCGCESLKKPALVKRSGSSEVESGFAYGIASVFCPPKFRGNGYASRMMHEVAQKLRDWQSNGEKGSKAVCSVLFSDIGKKFYATLGWQPFASAHVALLASTAPPPQSLDLPTVRELRVEELAELCAADEKCIRRRLQKHDSSRTAVALVPSAQIIFWHHAREEFVAEELLKRSPEIKGAIVDLKGGDLARRIWCYWTRTWRNPAGDDPNTLHILRLAVEDDTFDDFAPMGTRSSAADLEKSSADILKAIAAVLAAAQAEAARWDMKVVELWNPSETSLAAAQLLDAQAVVLDREEESIASLLWYGEGSHEDVDWECNEKFGWC